MDLAVTEIAGHGKTKLKSPSGTLSTAEAISMFFLKRLLSSEYCFSIIFIIYQYPLSAWTWQLYPCSMCTRLIINAGISTVIVRDDKENFRVINVADEWIVNDETLRGESNY